MIGDRWAKLLKMKQKQIIFIVNLLTEQRIIYSLNFKPSLDDWDHWSVDVMEFLI